MKVAIIPARGGSKRIPKKNIKSFLGSPMLAYPINLCRSSGLFDHIIVSTDCDDISNTAKKCGAEVPFTRPADLSDDFVGTGPVMQHAVQWVESNLGKPEYVCCLYPTTPLLTPELLEQGLNALLQNRDKFYAFSVARYRYPVKRALTYDQEHNISMLFPEHELTRSQDLNEVFHDAGQFYWGTPEAFLQQLPTFGPGAIPIFLPKYRVVDIDDEEDWCEAEYLYQVLQLQNKQGG